MVAGLPAGPADAHALAGAIDVHAVATLRVAYANVPADQHTLRGAVADALPNSGAMSY